MLTLWRRPTLLLLFLAIMVVITWMMEMLLWMDTGYTSFQLVSSLRTLSVSQIRSLLEARGVQYASLLEKSEIISLLEQSGPVYFGEVIRSEKSYQAHLPIEISGRDEYFEQIHEESERIWLIEIQPGEGQYADHRVLDDRTWRHLTPKLSALNIHSAIVTCQFDRRFCAKQGWSLPQLVMILPSKENYEDYNINGSGNLNLRSYGKMGNKEYPTLTSTTQLTHMLVLSWIAKELISRVSVVENIDKLEETWLNVTHVQKEKIPYVIHISELLTPPLLLATLGLRFSTRIKFASFTVKKEEKEQVTQLLKKYKINGPPGILVVTSEGATPYGHQNGEFLTNLALDSYIRILHPRMNDVFLVSLILANFLSIADFVYIFDTRLRVWKYIVRTILRVLAYNVVVFIAWLAVTASLKFDIFNSLLQSGLWLFHFVNATFPIHFVRYHWIMLESNPMIFWTTINVFGVLVVFWRFFMKNEESVLLETEGDNWWTVFPMDSYIFNVLFRPMASLSRPRPSQDLGLEEGMELLIERLATPDLWLHPVISNDYIENLPLWRFDGWGTEEDLKSESETDLDSPSDNENDNLLESHTCCQTELCKLCVLWTTVKEIYVCHRCAMLKRKLERQYLRYRKVENISHQHLTYEKLLKVCENCIRTRKDLSSSTNTRQSDSGFGHTRWLLSPQRLTELKWSAPVNAIESRVCAICLGRYHWSAVLCGLPCGHHYHHACITEWLVKDNHHCPTCRWPTYKIKSHHISSHDHEE